MPEDSPPCRASCRPPRRALAAAAIALDVRLRKMLRAGLVVLFATIAVAGSASAFAATYYVDRGSAACSDSGPGSAATPWCSTVNLPGIPSGSTVVLHAGSYEGFVLTDKRDVTIKAAPGERPELRGEVRLEGLQSARITLRGLNVAADGDEIGQMYVRQTADVLLEGLHLDRALFRSRATSGLVIADSVVKNGPADSEAFAQGLFCGCGIDARGLVDVPTSNITVRDSRFLNLAGDGIHLNDVVGSHIEGNYFHMTEPERAETHVDTIQALKGADHVIRDNEGYGWRHGILTTDDAPQDGPDADDRAMVVENNLIHALNYAFNGAPGPNSLIVNNTWTGSDGGVAKGAIVRWTVGSKPGTTDSAGAVFANNVVDGNLADDERLTYVANYVDPAVPFAAGYELPAGSPAIDAADPAYAPELDLRGRARVGAPDIGALERRGETPARRAPARLRVLRARVRDRRLVMRLRVHRRATGRLRATYVSGGRRTRFAVRIPRRGRTWTVRRAVRGRPTGILRLRYAGNRRVRPGRVRVRIRAGNQRSK
jgi:hypothetical protein